MATKKVARKAATRTSGARTSDDTNTELLHIPAKYEERWKTLLATVRKARTKGTSLWDQQYEAVAEIAEHTPPLYLFAHSSFEKFCAAELGEEARNVRRWMRVAKFFSPQDETTYKVTRLDALVRWAEKRAKKKITGRFPLKLEDIRITVVRDGVRQRVTALEASPREIDEDEPKKRGESEERAPHRLELEAQRVLKKHRDLAAVECVYRDGTMSFTGVPAHAGSAFAAALSEIDWDASERES
jgi:hypothetical protein